MGKTQKSLPLSARVTVTDAEHSVAVVTIFDMNATQEFRGPNHHAEAVGFANRWNDHLEKEWRGVRETSALIMHKFTEYLMERGVDQSIINAAFEDVRIHGPFS